MTLPDLDREACYRALAIRDARFDGRFYTAVLTTGIYCRPICPARTPKIENCLFLPSAAAAHQLGFRPCLRCRPEVAPGLAGWKGSANTVIRALRLIAEGGLDDDGVETLAGRLGVGGRHLRRLFNSHIGASPVAVAQAHRILFAKKLIDESRLSMVDIAMAAGFGSLRRFNEVFLRTYKRPPASLRRAGRTECGAYAAIHLKLPFTPPYDWQAMIGFLAARAIPEVEEVVDGRYRRSFQIGASRGIFEVSGPEDGAYLKTTIRIDQIGGLAAVVARLRHLFDLDADIGEIDRHLATDSLLAPLVAARPGIRVPGAWSDFELAVRAVFGQQVSVAGATTLAGRLTKDFGKPLPEDLRSPGVTLLFPEAEAIAHIDPAAIGLPARRARCLESLAAAMAAEPTLLGFGEDLTAKIGRLTALPGIGPWTAHYIAMRALRETDAFPQGDLGLLRALGREGQRAGPAELAARAEFWRPWRAYAALRLWIQADHR